MPSERFSLGKIGSAVALSVILLFVLAKASGGSSGAENESYDLVIANGRVMDPESGLDGVRSVGIRGGKVAAISQKPLTGKATIDAKPIRPTTTIANTRIIPPLSQLNRAMIQTRRFRGGQPPLTTALLRAAGIIARLGSGRNVCCRLG